jgi:DNA-binding NtrC family response regulator
MQPRLTRPITVLVAEDEPAIRLVAADTLMEEGFTVLEAANAAEALEIIRLDGTVEVLFTDVHMPGRLDGLDLAHEVLREHPAIGVVMTSGRARPDDSVMPQGAAFLPKPYRPSVLVEAILSQLDCDAPDRALDDGEEAARPSDGRGASPER